MYETRALLSELRKKTKKLNRIGKDKERKGKERKRKMRKKGKGKKRAEIKKRKKFFFSFF